MSKRVFIIVLDSCGIGCMPDAADFGDAGANTMLSISKSDKFRAENLRKLGLANIDGVGYLGPVPAPEAAFARIAERSKGKDTTVGHWEIAGIVSEKPLPTFPDGFPEELLKAFSEKTGRGVLCNLPYSGTKVLEDYGEEHLKTGSLIVYTSADSVFQIAAHEDIVPPELLYGYCREARGLLKGDWGVGRVIARPFIGEPGNFTRTSRRHDFSLEPPGKTMLDCISESGLDCIAVGKIYDIFAGRGTTEHIYTAGNTDGMAKTLEYADRDFEGLCFVNLVDFDMLYGHRNNVDGYAGALAEFDGWLSGFLPKLREDDILMITADHGCDPGYTCSTDHSREYIPLIVYGKRVRPVNLGTRTGFCDIGRTVLDYLGVEGKIQGESFLSRINKI
ncbi:MAG: phosphopentomutase [Clostridia bacterium]|nr:phosphopentomutase [Clostridia bacterium]